MDVLILSIYKESLYRNQDNLKFNLDLNPGIKRAPTNVIRVKRGDGNSGIV